MQVKEHPAAPGLPGLDCGGGLNILRIGLLAYATQVSLPHILLSLLVFFLFQVFVFGRLVGKHTRRILGYWEDRQFFLRFF
ncbi:MAG: hypothetical protein ACLT9P_09655 [Evtepia gabavorous]